MENGIKPNTCCFKKGYFYLYDWHERYGTTERWAKVLKVDKKRSELVVQDYMVDAETGIITEVLVYEPFKLQSGLEFDLSFTYCIHKLYIASDILCKDDICTQYTTLPGQARDPSLKLLNQIVAYNGVSEKQMIDDRYFYIHYEQCNVKYQEALGRMVEEGLLSEEDIKLVMEKEGWR